MRVKKYVARTLPEAMAQVKADLGAEAVILHTQPVRVGGIFGLFGQRMIEVMAAGRVAEAKPAPAGPAPAPAPAPASDRVAPAAGFSAPVAPHAGTALLTPPAADEMDRLRDEMARMRAMVGRMLERIEIPDSLRQADPELKGCYATLVDHGVEKELAAAVVRKAQQRLKRAEGPGTRPATLVREMVEWDLGQPETIDLVPGERRVVALTGPTGVGKTTTLAKLAAAFTLGRRARVAVITADTYRIAAVEQLQTYCDIIGIPLEVSASPGDMVRAVARHRDKDLVLVDTAGRSHRNAAQMEELEQYLRALHPDETYLTVSMTASSRDALAVAEAFGTVGYDRLILTKFDEAAMPGNAYNLAVRTRKPLSYLTTGQNVPDDLEVAHPEKISRLVAGDAS